MQSNTTSLPRHVQTLYELIEDRGYTLTRAHRRELLKDVGSALIDDTLLVIKDLTIYPTKPAILSLISSIRERYPSHVMEADGTWNQDGKTMTFSLPLKQTKTFILFVLRRVSSSQGAAFRELEALCGETNFQILTTESPVAKTHGKANTQSSIRALRYLDISYNPTKVAIVPEYTRLKQYEEEELLRSMRTTKELLPKIFISDPSVKYFNFPMGCILRERSRTRDRLYFRVVSDERDLVI